MTGDVTMTGSEIEGLQRQINALGDKLDKGFDRIEELVGKIEERVRRVENSEAKYEPLINSRIDSIVTKIGQHEAAIGELKKTTQRLAYTNEILKWILGVFTVIATSLIVKFMAGG